MNKIYRVIWCAVHQVWIAVSELTRGAVKGRNQLKSPRKALGQAASSAGGGPVLSALKPL